MAVSSDGRRKWLWQGLKCLLGGAVGLVPTTFFLFADGFPVGALIVIALCGFFIGAALTLPGVSALRVAKGTAGVIGAYNAPRPFKQWILDATLGDSPAGEGPPASPAAQAPPPAKAPATVEPPELPYRGLPLLEESRTADGWCFGLITNPSSAEGCDWGDGFVVAPDNTRAGLTWHVGPAEIEVSVPADEDRWGVYSVGISQKVHNRHELAEQLRAWLPDLQRRHADWAAGRGRPDTCTSSA